MNINEPLLVVEGITKAFDDNQVLSQVDLVVRPGEVIGLLGRNGAGKSTLSKILAGQTSSDAGQIRIRGAALDPRRVMLVDPEHQLDGNLSIAEAVFRGLESPMDAEEMLVRTRRALAQASMPLLPTDRLSGLSAKDLRMIEVARMLTDPRDLIIIDELSNGFSRIEQEDLRYSMMRNVEQGRSVIYVTHHLDEALRLCDRIAILRDGMIAEVFNSADVTSEQLAECIFGEAPKHMERLDNSTDEVALELLGVDLGDKYVDIRVNRGEILGLSDGPGAQRIMDALLGKSPELITSATVVGSPVSISCPNDLPVMGVAVLTSMTDPRHEAFRARNLSMLGGEDEFDEFVEETTEILLLFKEAEERVSRALERPLRSTGERRWQQLQELTELNAKIMVLINPTEGLDLVACEKFGRILDAITSNGTAVVLVSGHEADLERMCDRVQHVDDELDLNLVQLVEAHQFNSSPAPRHALAVGF